MAIGDPVSPFVKRVVRVDKSPMNAKVKIAQLDCGHDLYIHPPHRAPAVGRWRHCEKCRDVAFATGAHGAQT